MGGAGFQQKYHRRESPTQTVEDAATQEATGEIWGRAAFGSTIPKVKAYTGPLPVGQRGIEFTADIPPDDGCAPSRAEWSGPRPGVVLQGDYARIKVVITKNTQV